jgi:hypothetical protein
MWQVMGRSKLGLLEGWFCRWLRNCSRMLALLKRFDRRNDANSLVSGVFTFISALVYV